MTRVIAPGAALGLLRQVVDKAVEECLGFAVVREPSRLLAEILERDREFAHLRDDAKRILREETSASWPRPTVMHDEPADDSKDHKRERVRA